MIIDEPNKRLLSGVGRAQPWITGRTTFDVGVVNPKGRGLRGVPQRGMTEAGRSMAG